jgi:hypothetical protein
MFEADRGIIVYDRMWAKKVIQRRPFNRYNDGFREEIIKKKFE